jgi:hypothetical protein
MTLISIENVNEFMSMPQTPYGGASRLVSFRHIPITQRERSVKLFVSSRNIPITRRERSVKLSVSSRFVSPHTNHSEGT